MVAPAVETGGPQRAARAGDGEGVAFDPRHGAESLDHGGHGGQPVDLLDSQLADVREDRGALGDGGGHGEGGHLVERRDLRGCHPGAMQRSGGGPDGNRARLAVSQGDGRAHAL